MKARFLLPLLMVLSVAVGCNCPTSQEVCANLPSQRELLMQKLFPMTYDLENAYRNVILEDSVLCGISRLKYEAYVSEEDNRVSSGLAKFTEEEIASASSRIGDLAPALAEFAADLRKSGKYGSGKDLSDSEFLKAAWETDAKAMNHVIDVYALGEKPRYAGIDSIYFNVNGNEIKYVRDDIRHNVILSAKDGCFYDVTLHSALYWLDANGRSEAVDFEPMAQGINKSAYASIGSIEWDKYPYGLILVLGCGPERPGEAISAQGRMRASYGALLYSEGKAPLIVVSGGRVHPYKTEFSEAEEMKKYLVETWGIPESAIIAEPHARHTTTNIRNTVRIMMEQGVPMDKPGLITSGASHIDYVCGDYFPKACKREMHVMPFSYGARLHPRVLEFYPSADAALVAAGEDPLDP